MTDLAANFAIAHNYRLHLPSARLLANTLDDISLTRLYKMAQDRRTQDVYGTFLNEVKTRLETFLKAHAEAATVGIDRVIDLTRQDSSAVVDFSSTVESVISLESELETMFADLPILPEMRLVGATWDKLPISRAPSGPEWG